MATLTLDLLQPGLTIPANTQSITIGTDGTVSVLVALVAGSFAAYALGRLRFRGRTVMLYLVLSMTMFPVYLVRRLEELTRHMVHPVPKRVALCGWFPWICPRVFVPIPERCSAPASKQTSR